MTLEDAKDFISGCHKYSCDTCPHKDYCDMIENESSDIRVRIGDSTPECILELYKKGMLKRKLDKI